MFVATHDKTLIEMSAVPDEKVFTLEHTPNEGDACVHDEGPHQERAKHERIAAFIGGDQRQDRKRISEKCAANIAHKNFCG